MQISAIAVFGEGRGQISVRGRGSKAIADVGSVAQELISGRELNSAAARGEPNLPGNLAGPSSLF